MKPRKWDSKTKAKIVLEGLKGKPVSQICNEYQIVQSQYYKWRDQFLSNIDQLFEIPQKSKQEHHLKQENQQLKALIGDLTVELKKSEDEWL
jgi:transposase-like protein